MIYLSAEVEVAEQNGGLRAGDEKNDENQKQEPKHVVHLMRPKTDTCDIRNMAEGFALWNNWARRRSVPRSYQMLFRMKKSWMKMQPKGRIPPITIPGMGLVKKDCSGI